MTEPYLYVYVNADGSARELHPNERRYLETPFSGGDGARPYIKDSYSQKNGWGEIKGFLERSKLPTGTHIAPPPAEDPLKPIDKEEYAQFLRNKGLEVTKNNDGTFTVKKPK